ncbi:hypothetical protein BN59_03764 [Legionella massiliensis]|uniref:SidC N-terminal domain-containing protein n=2 Tax=Legionella TaxID=445 RepID=A0A0W0WRM1_9GAMM|nr:MULTISPECIES: hypothetical protein [Legionella]KTD34981.1 hypothetical protein Lnau_1871 [Legionella nautarum]CDZ79446.1 hypothetical protein BN59_03764 [Legionella massiliensis]CEE15184.1 hypothetical protein BN1094_03764 [Legionella massiliensis]
MKKSGDKQDNKKLQLNASKLSLSHFLHCVARGEQEEAERLLNIPVQKNGNYENLLLAQETFTDYSDRTFVCTAYEYAYWAKDTHMCRMLEQYMDKDTKSDLLKRCKSIERDGLKYSQQITQVDGTKRVEQYCTKHFDFTPLKTALEQYIQGFAHWSWDERKKAWMAVGVAQRDLPVHVINEYCRPDRTFYPLPLFDEDKLPRVITYYDHHIRSDVSLYPLVISDSSGLGVDFALIRGRFRPVAVRARRCGSALRAACELAAISHLDEVRTTDLKQSVENLG